MVNSTRSWTFFSIFLSLAGLAWIWVSRADPGSMSSGPPPAPRQGFAAPDFSLQDASGESYSLAELRGRPVLVNMWATWCPPCRAEMPAIERVYQDYREQGFVVLAVNATSQDDPKAAGAFAGEHGLTFPILLDSQGSVMRQYQINSFPTSFFIDPEGTIRDMVVGGPMSEALVRIRVEQLYNGKTLERP